MHLDGSPSELRVRLRNLEASKPRSLDDAKQLAHTATKIRWVLESRERLARLMRKAAA